MDLKYDFVPDLHADDAHGHQLRAVPRGSRVLELGCATGYLSRAMAEQLGCRVTGVELEPAAAERARAHCARVVIGDLDHLDLAAVFGDERFDVALFGDVLEHLKDPGKVLAATRGLLAPGGRVVATIPNVAHGDVRLALLAGRFEYRRLGLLDDTHLRFFTLASTRALFEDAGFVVQRLDRIRAPLFATELEVERAGYPPEVLAYVAADPEATTYQFVVVASPRDEAAPLVALRLELEAGEAERAKLAAALDAERARGAALEDKLTALAAELEATRAAAEAARHAAEVAAAAVAAAHSAREAGEARERALTTELATLGTRYARIRKLSYVNPLVVADALWRRATRAGGHGDGAGA